MIFPCTTKSEAEKSETVDGKEKKKFPPKHQFNTHGAGARRRRNGIAKE